MDFGELIRKFLVVLNPKGPKYLYGTKYGFCSSNFPYGLGKYPPYGYLGPFGEVGTDGQRPRGKRERKKGKDVQSKR